MIMSSRDGSVLAWFPGWAVARSVTSAGRTRTARARRSPSIRSHPEKGACVSTASASGTGLPDAVCCCRITFEGSMDRATAYRSTITSPPASVSDREQGQGGYQLVQPNVADQDSITPEVVAGEQPCRMASITARSTVSVQPYRSPSCDPRSRRTIPSASATFLSRGRPRPGCAAAPRTATRSPVAQVVQVQSPAAPAHGRPRPRPRARPVGEGVRISPAVRLPGNRGSRCPSPATAATPQHHRSPERITTTIRDDGGYHRSSPCPAPRPSSSKHVISDHRRNGVVHHHHDRRRPGRADDDDEPSAANPSVDVRTAARRTARRMEETTAAMPAPAASPTHVPPAGRHDHPWPAP